MQHTIIDILLTSLYTQLSKYAMTK